MKMKIHGACNPAERCAVSENFLNCLLEIFSEFLSSLTFPEPGTKFKVGRHGTKVPLATRGVVLCIYAVTGCGKKGKSTL